MRLVMALLLLIGCHHERKQQQQQASPPTPPLDHVVTERCYEVHKVWYFLGPDEMITVGATCASAYEEWKHTAHQKKLRDI